MKQIDLPILSTINKAVGPKLAATIAAGVVVAGQFAEYNTSASGVPFSPGILDTIVEFFKSTSLVESIPAPIAALFAFYLRRAGTDTVDTEEHATMDVEEYLDRGRKRKQAMCPHNPDRVTMYADTTMCKDCGKMWDTSDPHPPTEDAPTHKTDGATIEALQLMFSETRNEISNSVTGLEEKLKVVQSQMGAMEKELFKNSERIEAYNTQKAGTGYVDKQIKSLREFVNQVARNSEDSAGADYVDSRIDELEIHLNKRINLLVTQANAKNNDPQIIVDPDDIQSVKQPTIGNRLFNLPVDTNEALEAVYGPPGEDNLVRIELPYEMKLAWDTDATVNSTLCHEMVAERLSNFLIDINEIYSEDEIEKYGLNLFGGVYNYRNMKGSLRMSTHAWGIAMDLNPTGNPYKAPFESTVFGAAELKPLLDAGEANGFLNAGRYMGKDTMHFQAAKFYRGGTVLT